MVTLQITAAHLGQDVRLFSVFDSFGNHFQLQGSGHAENGADEDTVLAFVGHIVDEFLVDFDDIDRQFLQITLFLLEEFP